MGSEDDWSHYGDFRVTPGWELPPRLRPFRVERASRRSRSSSPASGERKGGEVGDGSARSATDSHVERIRARRREPEKQGCAGSRSGAEIERPGALMSRPVKSHVRVVVGAAGMVAVSMISACLHSTGPQPSLIQLAGTWNYTGVQTSPVRETLTGTLKVSSESGMSFQGRVDLVGLNQAGQTRALSGLVSGSEQGTDVIDFDASVEAPPAGTVGQIVADTISGTWIRSAPDGISSGTFRVERVTR